MYYFFYIRSMNPEVSVTACPMEPEDKKLLRKNLLSVLLFLIFFSVVFAFIANKFYSIFSEEQGIAKYFAWGVMIFILLVAVFILISYVASAFAKNKVVKEGFITSKEVDVRAGTRTSSGSNNYYFSLGNEKQTTTINYFHRFEVGDRVRLHYARPFNSLFRVEVLESAVDKQLSSVSNTINAIPETLVMDAEDKLALRKFLYSQIVFLFISLFVAAFVAVAVIIGLVISYDEFGSWKPYYSKIVLLVPAVVVLSVIFFFNRRLWRGIFDFVKGEKIAQVDVVTEIFNSSRPMLNKYTTSGSFSHGEYKYATTRQGFFIGPVNQNFSINAGDSLYIETAPRSRVVINYKLANK